MTLLISVFAAVIFTFLWYKNAPEDLYRLKTLCFMFWGSSLMWLTDAVFEFMEEEAAYFTPTPAVMLNDTFLGLSVLALGLSAWIIDLLIHDPKQVVKKMLLKRRKEQEEKRNLAIKASETI